MNFQLYRSSWDLDSSSRKKEDGRRSNIKWVEEFGEYLKGRPLAMI